MMGSTSDKRILSNSKDNQSDEKQQSQVAKELAPECARGLISDIAMLLINVNTIKMDIRVLKHNFNKLEDKICAIKIRCDNMEDNTLQADERAVALEGRVKI